MHVEVTNPPAGSPQGAATSAASMTSYMVPMTS